MPIISRYIWGNVPSYCFLLVVFRLSGLRFRAFLYLVRVCLESKEISPSYNRPFDRSVCLYQSVCFVRRTAVLFLYSCFVIFFKHIRTLRIDSWCVNQSHLPLYRQLIFWPSLFCSVLRPYEVQKQREGIIRNGWKVVLVIVVYEQLEGWWKQAARDWVSWLSLRPNDISNQVFCQPPQQPLK